MKTYHNAVIILCSVLTLGTSAVADDRDVDGWMKSANFILGVYNVEDMVQIPGTKWIIGSGVTSQGPGMNLRFLKKDYLHVFNAETETGGAVKGFDIKEAPDKARFPDTTTPPDWEVFGPHGIALGEQKGDKITLFAVNHGAREAVQVFEIDYSGDTPTFTWIGTVLSPEDGFVDAVAWIPGTDGFVATALLDPRDPEGDGKKQMAGEPVGWVREWQAESGWKTVPGTENFSAPNGIVVNEDGSRIFVAPSGNFAVYRISRGGDDPEVAEVKLDGFPDNIRWSQDGKSLLVAVHTEEMEKFVAAQLELVKYGRSMLTSFNITRVNPETMEAKIVMPSGIYGALGAGTTAIEVGDRLWVSSTGSDRIGVFDLNP